jgi:uncharacterized protein (TIGR02266 family)
MTEGGGFDNRRSARVPIALEIEYRSAGAFLVAYSTNLSKGGIFIETSTPLPVGTTLTLRLHAPNTAPCEVQGSVAWVRGEATGPGQPAGMGLVLDTAGERYGAVVDEIAFSFSGIQVLLGTGEPAPRAILSRYLRSILSCEIVEAKYDDSGLAFTSKPLDLAVIDLDSSGPAGLELIANLRYQERTSTVPIIALGQLERDRLRAHERGADEALTNPPLFAELQAAVLRCISRPALIR